MDFMDRGREMERLDELMARKQGGLAVVYGRRRIGKTRLLLEWVARHGGLYTVADQSAGAIQRRYFATAAARHLPGFAEVEYPDWRSLLARLAGEAGAKGWRGPVVIDELPYLVLASPELPSALQHWIDHDARAAGLVVAVAGSSQRMMQGLVLGGSAPLFGRAQAVLDVGPLPASFLARALEIRSAKAVIEHYAAWGGVPRYWELARDVAGPVTARIDRLVLDPLGPLHREPDRVLIEEVPSALEVRPVLDVIGAGCHRVSEIAARLGRPATSLSRPLARLVEMRLVRRECPFGEPERKSRRALYAMADPFFRLWFRVVAPQRGVLAVASPDVRLDILNRHWNGLVATAWEDLCRELASALPRSAGGPWGPASRWWGGNEPEWDVVAEAVGEKRLLLGEAKWISASPSDSALRRHLDSLAARARPNLPATYDRHEVVRALFVPTAGRIRRRAGEPMVITAEDLVGEAL